MRAGSIVCGIVRRDALTQAGVCQYVMIPGMLIGELAWYGQFAKANRVKRQQGCLYLPMA